MGLLLRIFIGLIIATLFDFFVEHMFEWFEFKIIIFSIDFTGFFISFFRAFADLVIFIWALLFGRIKK